MFNLLKNAKVTRVVNATAAGTTDINSTSVDMQGYDGVMFVAALGTLTATQVTKLQADDSADDSAFTVITNAVTAAAADGDSNKLLIVDVFRPQRRYVRATVDRGTANAVVDGVWAIQYHTAKGPVTQGSTVSQSVLVAH